MENQQVTFALLETNIAPEKWWSEDWVVVWNIFYVHPYLGKWSNLTNIFQMGWNHQPEDHIYLFIFFWGGGELLLLGMVNRLNSSIETRRQKSDWRQGLWQWQWLCGSEKLPRLTGKDGRELPQKNCCEIVKKIGYWRIIPVSKYLAAPMYKPFSPFVRGIILLRGLTNHGY